MRIDAAIICEQAEPRPDRLINLTGIGIDTLVVESFPNDSVVPLYIRVVGPHDTAEHHLIIQIEDSDGNMQCELLEPVAFAQRPPNLPPGWDVQAHRIVGPRFTVTAPGAYRLLLSVDGGERISQPIFFQQK